LGWFCFIVHSVFSISVTPFSNWWMNDKLGFAASDFNSMSQVITGSVDVINLIKNISLWFTKIYESQNKRKKGNSQRSNRGDHGVSVFALSMIPERMPL
jgi:hypothetical protein